MGTALWTVFFINIEVALVLYYFDKDFKRKVDKSIKDKADNKNK